MYPTTRACSISSASSVSYTHLFLPLPFFTTVLAVGEEGNVKFGNPTVAGAKVTGKVVKNGKGKKLNILTYRPKKGSMRCV